MPRTIIAAVLALLLLAPAANARPLMEPQPTGDKPLVMPERITDHAGPKPLVMPERITDHRVDMQTSSLAGTTDERATALAQEAYYKSQGAALAALVKEQESTGGSGNHAVPGPDSDVSPWVVVAICIGGAALLAAAATVIARRTRPRAGVA
jgi:hypothetical protein